MGCDIHLCVEEKSKYASSWMPVFTGQLSLWRNYEVFAKLANVRNRDNTVPISEPRGLPADVSPEVRQWLTDQDYHSHSWISRKEFKENFSPDWNSDWYVLGRFCVLYARSIAEVRFVFAFDN